MKALIAGNDITMVEHFLFEIVANRINYHITLDEFGYCACVCV